jgi:tight adherence protein B
LTSATLLAAAAGALAAPVLLFGGASAGRVAMSSALPVARGFVRWTERVVRPLRRARIEGAEPTDRERLRLQTAAAALGLVFGGVALGLKAGVVFAAASAWVASRSLAWHRGRYRRRLEEGVSGAALAIADALASGHSVRGALMVCGRGLGGPIGSELRAVGHELELGADTEHCLERLRAASRSRRIDLMVAAVRVQRRSGGSLAALLRGIAATLEDHDRVRAETRAATAQARFTSVVVLLLPFAGLLLAELATPGIVGRMTGSGAGAWLLAAAGALQLAGTLVVRRLTRLED